MGLKIHLLLLSGHLKAKNMSCRVSGILILIVGCSGYLPTLVYGQKVQHNNCFTVLVFSHNNPDLLHEIREEFALVANSIAQFEVIFLF